VPCAGHDGDYLFEVEPNELLDPEIRVGAERLATLWVVPISRDEESEVAYCRQLMDQTDMTLIGLALLRPNAEGMRCPPPGYLARNGTNNAKVPLYKLIPASPQLDWRQRIYVFLINLMPKQLVF
jgi:hypothetical protein